MNPLNGLRTLAWRIGFAIRETGQALERTGTRLQGIHSFEEVRKFRRYASVTGRVF